MGTRRFALFNYGFRPFFLLAGLSAAILIPVWLHIGIHRSPASVSLPAMYWHAHEMLFGFVMAAIAGFLLTAVRSSTAARGFRGRPLAILAILWFAGRVAMASAGNVPFWMTALGELSFLPAIILLLTPPLLRSPNRNTPLLAVLCVLWAIDMTFMVAMYRVDAHLAGFAVVLAVDLVLILLTVIAGRIVPAYTSSALRRRGDDTRVVKRPWLETTVVALMIAVAVVDIVAPQSYTSAAIAVAAAIAHAIRLWGWRTWRTRGDSMLWILHVAYAWLPLGLALKALWLFDDMTFAMKWQHALTMGAIASMIFAVMTRAALGHTGRAMTASPLTTTAYVLLTFGVLVRVFGSAIWPHHYPAMLIVAGCAWTLSFLLFVILYTPILAGPRADGKPG
jgi:uncharacterized protein involved in response to NO